jgi:hypothetical protein
MISLNPISVPDIPATLQTLSDLVSILSDPAGSATRVAELQAATAALQQASAESRAQIAAFTIAEQDHKNLLAQREADAAERLTADRSAFDAECKRRMDEISAREANVKELQATAADDAKSAAALRSDYDRRLKIIRSASA